MLRWELLFCIIKDRKRKTQQKIVDINLSCLQILNIWWKIESWVIDLKNECYIRRIHKTNNNDTRIFKWVIKNDDIGLFQLNIFFWFQFLDNEWKVIFAHFLWEECCVGKTSVSVSLLMNISRTLCVIMMKNYFAIINKANVMSFDPFIDLNFLALQI